jgi:hypothetical protein
MSDWNNYLSSLYSVFPLHLQSHLDIISKYMKSEILNEKVYSHFFP